MRIKITEFTWIHTTLFAIATAFVGTACDEATALDEEELAVEELADEDEKPRSGPVDGDAAELTDDEAEEEVNAEEERRRRDDDDDGWRHGGRRDGWRDGWRHDGWRHDGWRHDGWRHDGWRHD